jgi:hypothetical protein
MYVPLICQLSQKNIIIIIIIINRIDFYAEKWPSSWGVLDFGPFVIGLFLYVDFLKDDIFGLC